MPRLYILVLALTAYSEKGAAAVWPAVGDKLVIFQNAAILEFFHALFGRFLRNRVVSEQEN